jgi:hypothetical protein
LKKLIIALVAGVAVFGAVFASAASLGLTTDELGAGSHPVTSCDEHVGVTYQTSYHTTVVPAGYYVDTITLTSLDTASCKNQVISATLSGTSDVSLVQLTKTCCIAGTGTTEIIPVTSDILAELVTGVHVVITGVENP